MFTEQVPCARSCEKQRTNREALWGSGKGRAHDQGPWLNSGFAASSRVTSGLRLTSLGLSLLICSIPTHVIGGGRGFNEEVIMETVNASHYSGGM